MATLSTAVPAICTMKMEREFLQVQGTVLSDRPVCRLPVSKGVLKTNSFTESRKPVAGIFRTSRLNLKTAHRRSRHQFVARALAADDGLPRRSRRVVIRYDEQSVPTGEDFLTQIPSSDQLQREHDGEEAHEHSAEGEENWPPFVPAGGRHHHEQGPEMKLSEEEGIIIENAHLLPLPANFGTDFARNQVGGWSESSCDEGSILYSESAAAALLDVGDMSTSSGISDELLIERLLESLPIYDRGQSAEHYRIRAVAYGKIGEYYSKGDGRSNEYAILDNEQKGLDVRMLTAMQQLADLILAEEGRSAADYNCRAQFFQNSAEIFGFNGGDADRADNSPAKRKWRAECRESLDAAGGCDAKR